MNVKELKQKIKKDMGLRWYWTEILLLLDFDYQYYNWLSRQYLKHLKKTEYYQNKMDKHYD